MQSKEERRAQIADCLRRRKIRLKSIGICQDCGAVSAKRGKTLCIDCLEYRTARAVMERMKTLDIEKMMKFSSKVVCGK